MEAARPALEHRSSRGGRWLRVRRFQLALWIAVLEGVLIVLGVVPLAVALVGAAVLIALHLFAGRRLPWHGARQASWIAATSQVFVALIPVVLLLLGALALIMLAALAAIALFVLLSRRR